MVIRLREGQNSSRTPISPTANGIQQGQVPASQPGSVIAFYDQRDLNAMTAAQLRAHAMLLASSLGNTHYHALPEDPAYLADWIRDVQLQLQGGMVTPQSEYRSTPVVISTAPALMTSPPQHQENYRTSPPEYQENYRELRPTSPTAQKVPGEVVWPAGLQVQVVNLQGKEVPYYEREHLMVMTVEQLRAHADVLHQRLGSSIGSPVPSKDSSLAEWILYVNGVCLRPLLKSAGTGASAGTTNAHNYSYMADNAVAAVEPQGRIPASASNIPALGPDGFSKKRKVRELKVGQRIRAVAPSGAERPAEIIEKDQNQVKIHYLHYREVFDEWLPVTSDRISSVELEEASWFACCLSRDADSDLRSSSRGYDQGNGPPSRG